MKTNIMNQQQDRQEEKQSRRAFFSTLARGGMLALLAFGSGYVLNKALLVTGLLA